MMFRNQTWLCVLLLVVALAQADQALRKRDVFQIEEVENQETADFFNAQERGMMTKEESYSSSSKGKGGKGGSKSGKSGKGGSSKSGKSGKGGSSSMSKSGKGGSSSMSKSGKGGSSKSAKKSAKKGGSSGKGGKGSKKDRVMDDFEDMVFGSMSMSM